MPTRFRKILGSVVLLAIAAMAVLTASTLSQPEGSLRPAVSYVVRGHRLAPVFVDRSGALRIESSKTFTSEIHHLFDWITISEGTRFLVSMTSSPGSRAGYNLVLIDEGFRRTSLGDGVLSARFAPHGDRVAYTTRSNTLEIVTIHGKKLASIEGGYDPSWSADSKKVVFSQDSNSRDTLSLVTLDITTGERQQLTADHRDIRPIFHPSCEWVLFVSDSRTDIASFWAVPAAGGTPYQLTNIGLKQVNDSFIPTPYKAMIWSPDGMSVAFDRKDGSDSFIWVLQFEPSFKWVLSAERLGTGLSPSWLDQDTLLVHTDDKGIALLEVSQ